MRVCRTRYIWDPGDCKTLSAELLCDMLVMDGRGGAPANVAGGASIHADETAQKPLAHLPVGFKQKRPSRTFRGAQVTTQADSDRLGHCQ